MYIVVSEKKWRGGGKGSRKGVRLWKTEQDEAAGGWIKGNKKMN
jgi:hypothetical protein